MCFAFFSLFLKRHLSDDDNDNDGASELYWKLNWIQFTIECCLDGRLPEQSNSINGQWGERAVKKNQKKNDIGQ